jgi:hypothetical protein
MQAIAHNTGLSSLRGISKNSPRHILIVGIGAMGTFPFKTVVGFESCAVLPVVEALHFDPIANVCLEDLVLVAMVGGDDGGKRTLS